MKASKNILFNFEKRSTGEYACDDMSAHAPARAPIIVSQTHQRFCFQTEKNRFIDTLTHKIFS